MIRKTYCPIGPLSLHDHGKRELTLAQPARLRGRAVDSGSFAADLPLGAVVLVAVLLAAADFGLAAVAFAADFAVPDFAVPDFAVPDFALRRRAGCSISSSSSSSALAMLSLPPPLAAARLARSASARLDGWLTASTPASGCKISRPSILALTTSWSASR